MKWQIKFLKNSVFGILPKSLQQKARKIKRSVLPCKLELERLTLKQGLSQVHMLKESGIDLNGKDYLELGTGWSPVIPLIFYLAGCRSLILIDSQRLMDNHAFQITCRQLIPYSKEISKHLEIPLEDIKNKLSCLINKPMDSALSSINCKYLAPFDLVTDNIPENSIDIITSRAVLEYIAPTVLAHIFSEFYRILRDEGATCHIIDNSDHWEHIDKSISTLNFLKYSEKTIKFMALLNPFEYLNRIRHSEYLELLKNSGFEIIKDESLPSKRALEQLISLNIHEDFKSFAPDDLATLTSYILAKKQN